MTAVTIMEAQPQDLARIEQIERAAFGNLGYSKFVLRQFIDLAGPLFLVARSSSDLEGYAVGLPTIQRDVGWILSVGVPPNLQRRGIGRQLSKSLIECLERAGCGRLKLTVKSENLSALRLYRSLEFRELDVISDYYGPGEDRIVMERTWHESQ